MEYRLGVRLTEAVKAKLLKLSRERGVAVSKLVREILDRAVRDGWLS